MLPVAGLPVTEHQILAAQKAGIHTLVLATSYLSEVFTPYFGDGSQWGMKILYAVEKEPLGTGGAIRNAAEMLGMMAGMDAWRGYHAVRQTAANMIGDVAVFEQTWRDALHRGVLPHEMTPAARPTVNASAVTSAFLPSRSTLSFTLRSETRRSW
jgi:dTDP-glucose pyrophosphorylase